MAKVPKVAVAMLFLMTTIHGQLNLLVDVNGIGNGPSLGQRSLTNTDGSANGGVPRSSKRWIKCRSLMWAKECEEGSVVIATHKLTTEEGCDFFCTKEDLCKTFMYNTESLDCGLTTAIKGTTTSNGISGPELSLKKPSLRRGNHGRNKAAAEKEDCTGFHFFDCDIAFGERDWPQDGLHRKGFWNPIEPNLQTCRENCQDGGHGTCGAYAWMDGTEGDMTKPGTCGIHSDNVDDLITFNCKWVTGRIGRIGGDPNDLYSCLFDHNRETLEKKLCRKGYCNLDHWGAPWDNEHVEDEESCKSTCFYRSYSIKRHCTHYKYFQGWGSEAEKDPDYQKCELYTVEEGPHPSYKCQMQVYLKKRLDPLGLKNFHQQCRAPEISGGGNTTTDPPITRPTTPTPLTTDSVASCKPNPCQNGGLCQDGTCYCKNGFTGLKCEIAPGSPCKPNPCQNGGLCQDGNCYCKNGFTGSKCEIPAQTEVQDVQKCKWYKTADGSQLVCGECREVTPWDTVPGMDGWCNHNCSKGNCPSTHCKCTSPP